MPEKYGWICPRCQAGHGPMVVRCVCGVNGAQAGPDETKHCPLYKWTCAHCGAAHLGQTEQPKGTAWVCADCARRAIDEAELYLVTIFGDRGPGECVMYATEAGRLAAAREHRKVEGDKDGLYKLDIGNGVPSLEPFSGDELE